MLGLDGFLVKCMGRGICRCANRAQTALDGLLSVHYEGLQKSGPPRKILSLGKIFIFFLKKHAGGMTVMTYSRQTRADCCGRSMALFPIATGILGSSPGWYSVNGPSEPQGGLVKFAWMLSTSKWVAVSRHSHGNRPPLGLGPGTECHPGRI